MGTIHTAHKYLKKYTMLSAAVLSTAVLASIFDGASFGMLIPVIQSFIGMKVAFLDKIAIHLKPYLPGLFATQNKTIALAVLVLFVIVIMKNIAVYASNVLTARLRFGIIKDTSADLMDNLIDYDVAFFDSAKTGHLVSVFSVETTRMGGFIMAVLRFTSILARVLVYATLLVFISPVVSIALFALVGITVLPLEIIMKKLKRLGASVSQALAEYNYTIIEILTGIRLIKISGTEPAEKKRFRGTADRIAKFSFKSNEHISLLIPISEVVIFGLISAGLLFLTHVAKVDLSTSFPYTATYLVVLVRGLSQLNTLNGTRSEAVNLLPAFSRYEELLDKRGKWTILSGTRTISHFSGSIKFDNVSFAYRTGKNVLHDVSLVIPKGKVVALVGASGAGKSTITNLIIRFYDVTSGRITVDDIDMRELDIRSWRRKIGFVSQDIFIFNTTVRENIAYGHPEPGETKVMAAAKAANAHDFIMALDKGYDTMLGERGVRLSGGQKQRLSIARAVMHDPEILILDEATSSLDTRTEELIRQAVDKLAKGRTVVAIAHRLSTVAHADSIIVLENGRIVESGRHGELLNNAGAYRLLYETQFTGAAGIPR